MRTFPTGATRGADADKPDYEGFLSPLVIRRYGEYMHKHRIQTDGTLRDSDNWQKGIPIREYAKSLWRHFLAVWMLHRGYTVRDKQSGNRTGMQDALCAVMFNSMGYLHELLKGEQ